MNGNWSRTMKNVLEISTVALDLMMQNKKGSKQSWTKAPNITQHYLNDFFFEALCIALIVHTVELANKSLSKIKCLPSLTQFTHKDLRPPSLSALWRPLIHKQANLFLGFWSIVLIVLWISFECQFGIYAHASKLPKYSLSQKQCQSQGTLSWLMYETGCDKQLPMLDLRWSKKGLQNQPPNQSSFGINLQARTNSNSASFSSPSSWVSGICGYHRFWSQPHKHHQTSFGCGSKPCYPGYPEIAYIK